MVKSCPKCGTEIPDDAKFCGNCGYNFNKQKTNNDDSKFNFGMLFMILIAAILIIGGAFILTSGSDSSSDVDLDDGDVEHVDLTITDVSGFDSDYGNKTSYHLHTEALFMDVPSDLNGYILKTKYYDKNNSLLGQETEKLSNVYYDTDYSISFGYVTTYKLPKLDHTDVEVIKNGETVDNYTFEIDTNKIDFLN